MARYIDADALLETLNKEEIPYDADINYFIMHAPTVDAVEVVRCKDCKKCEERHTANYLPFLYCKLDGRGVLRNFFCCWAERREDENT